MKPEPETVAPTPDTAVHPVVALHCSGGSARQWRGLAAALTPRPVLAPDLYGTRSRGHWTGTRRFRLVDEAAPILETVFPETGQVHLVGHSYGGALALHIARRAPDRIASLSLYEPACFQLLTGQAERALLHGLERIGRGTPAGATDAATGADERHAREFVAFWSGADAWSRMSDAARAGLISYIRKGPLELAALMNEPGNSGSFDWIRCPVLLLRGSDLSSAAAVATDKLARMIPEARRITIEGAGHLGPLTHAQPVTALIARNIRHAEGFAFETARAAVASDA